MINIITEGIKIIMLITDAVLISPLLMTDMYPSLARTLNLPPIIAGVPKSAIERINVRKNTAVSYTHLTLPTSDLV